MESIYRNLSVFFALGFAILWIAATPYLWKITPHSVVIPLDYSAFEIWFDILQTHRIVLPVWLINPFIVVNTYLPSLFFGFWILLISRIDVGSSFARLLVAVCSGVIFFRLGAPGILPTELGNYFIAVLVLLPILTRLKFLETYSLVTFGIIFQFIYPQTRFLIFWTVFCIMTAKMVTFFLVNRGHIRRSFREFAPEACSLLLAFACIGLWALFLSKPIVSVNPDVFIASNMWWLAWVTGSLCVIACWLEPMNVDQWLAASMFSQGLFIFRGMDLSVKFLVAFILLRIFFKLTNKWVAEFDELPKAKWIASMGLLSILCLAVSAVQISKTSKKSTFESEWIPALSEIRHASPQRLVFVGKGLRFASYFLKGDLYDDPSILTETHEKNIVHLLENNQIDGIVLQKEFVRNFWKDWIKNGEDPQISNQSVISRLMQYEGEELETATLKLSPVKSLEMKDFESSPEFSWIKLKAPQGAVK